MGKLSTPLPSKYKYRYEQILNILAASGEVPTNLYKYIDISNDTYRRLLSDLRKKGLIRTVTLNHLTGYILTLEGKQYLRGKKNLPLNFEDIRTKASDTVMRRRRHLLSAIYATFDKLNVLYETTRKPNRNTHKITDKGIVFYTSKEYKKELAETGDTFKGSRTHGLLVGGDFVYPIYVTNEKLPVFNKSEFNLVSQINTNYSQNENTNKAVLFCQDTTAAGDILREMFDFQATGQGVNILQSSIYKDVHIIPLDENLYVSFWSVYNSKKLQNALIKQMRIDTKETYYQCDGKIDGESVIFLFNLSVGKLKAFLSINERRNERAHIICYDYLAPIISSLITDKNKIKLKVIKAEWVLNHYIKPTKEEE